MIPRTLFLVALGIFSPRAAAFQSLPVIPTPRSVTQRTGMFAITSQTRVILGDGTTEADRALVRLLNERLEALDRKALPIVHERSVRTVTKASLYLATPRSEFTQTLLRNRNVESRDFLEREGYLLDVRSEGIMLVAASHRGRFYGMTTLLALLRIEGRSLQVPQGTIIDRPARSTRGLRLLATGHPDPLLEHLMGLIPRFSQLKLNTLAVAPIGGTEDQAAWSQAFDRLQALSEEYGVEVILQPFLAQGPGTSTPPMHLGFLPPGPDMTAFIATLAENELNGEDVPNVLLESPSLYSFQWIDYLASWISENTWSALPADLTAHTRTFFGFGRDHNTSTEAFLSTFALLQQTLLSTTWDELWVRPDFAHHCIHAVARRHTVESLLAGARITPAPDGPLLAQAITARIRLLDFVSARLRAEERLSVADQDYRSRIESVKEVLRRLEHLEHAIFDAARPAPFGLQTGSLISAVSFQRQCWSEVLTLLERGIDPADTLLSGSWMRAPGESSPNSADTISYLRMVNLQSLPAEARLVIWSFVPARPRINDVFIGEVSRFSPLHTVGHPTVSVYDVTAELQEGENSLVLSLSGGIERDRCLYAVLECVLRSGSTETVFSDTLWRSSAEGHPAPAAPPQPGQLWRNVNLTPRPFCRDLFSNP